MCIPSPTATEVMARKPSRTKQTRGVRTGVTGSPFLTQIALQSDRLQPGVHPFTLPLFEFGLELELTTPITFLVGENGSGKSSLLEAIAWACGFGAQGGSRDSSFAEGADGHALGRALRLGWRQRVTDGFYLRSETFFNFAAWLEEVGSSFSVYGGRPLNAQSHGEAFLALFQHRFEDGLYLLDEPEAALSPARQLAFLRVLHDLTRTKIAQFIIATHSPMLLTFPGATVLQIEDGRIAATAYDKTEHYSLTRAFLEEPERFYRFLLADDD